MKKGFTLTELMIALTIIGVLVAVLTPAIMKSRPDKTKMLIKKSYYSIEQIVADMINDQRIYPDKTDDCYDNEAGTTCYWGFDDGTKVSYNGKDTASGSKEKFVSIFRDKVNTKSESGYTIITNDGITYDFSNIGWQPNKTQDFTSEENYAKLLIDVNGEEGPNCRQKEDGCSEDDFDRYVIQILANGKMRIDPDDEKAIEYISVNTSIKSELTTSE